jgi:alkanesulfonate monooxygenase SsuD/methylene tetrahydromethanopterin reductase-like flavin-dependent oxidoreductase (luciferase family)
MAASGQESAELAAEISDGLISTAPKGELVETFEKAGGSGRPRYGMVKVCWAHSAEEARATVKQWWPTSAVSGPLHSDLPTPRHFEDVVEVMGDRSFRKYGPQTQSEPLCKHSDIAGTWIRSHLPASDRARSGRLSQVFQK